MPRNTQNRKTSNEAAAEYGALADAVQAEDAAQDAAAGIGGVAPAAPEVERIATDDPRIDAPSEPLIGKTLDASGNEIEQVGKHPDLPADVPVQPGTAFDPSLPPLRPHTPVVDSEE